MVIFSLFSVPFTEAMLTGIDITYNQRRWGIIGRYKKSCDIEPVFGGLGSWFKRSKIKLLLKSSEL